MVYQARYWLSFCNKESLKYNDSKKVIHFPLRQKSEVGVWSKIGSLFLKINQRPIFLLSHCSDTYYGIFLTYMAEAISPMQLHSSAAMWGKEKEESKQFYFKELMIKMYISLLFTIPLV